MLLCFFHFYLFTSGAFKKENSTYPQLFLYNIKYTSTALDNAYQSENKLIEPGNISHKYSDMYNKYLHV